LFICQLFDKLIGGFQALGGVRIQILSQELVVRSAQAALEKHARPLEILDLRGLSNITDFFLIVGVQSERQGHAVADCIMEILSRLGHFPHHTEGYPQSGWILLDFEDVIIHVFREDLRVHYDLEGLWCDAPRIQIPFSHAHSNNQAVASFS